MTEYTDQLMDKNYDSFYIPDPDEKPKSEWNVDERRAYILAQIKEVGLPKNLNKTELADRFGVSRVTIYEDLNVLRHWIRENVDKGHKEEAYMTMVGARDALMDDGEYRKAAKVQQEFSEWLADRGEIEETPDKFEVDHSGDGGGIDITFNEVSREDDDGE